MPAPWRVRLTAAERAVCLEESEQILKKVDTYGPSYTGLEEPDRYFKARTGEMTLCKWAEAHSLEFIPTTNTQGLSDRQDGLLTLEPGTIVSVDIKNSHHPRTRYMMQPLAQAAKYDQDIYIGARGLDQVIHVDMELCGWFWGWEFRAHAIIKHPEDTTPPKVKVPTRMVPLDRLHDLAKLVELAQRTEVTAMDTTDSMFPDPTPADVRTEDKIAELKRELAMRRAVFPKWVSRGRISSEDAHRRIITLEAILADYLRADP